MFDPRNDLSWTGGITSSRPAQPEPLATGATVEWTARFLGRRFTYGYLVTRHDPDRLVVLKADRPFPMLVRYELEATTAAPSSRSMPAGPGEFLRLGEPADEPAGPQEHRSRPRKIAGLLGAVMLTTDQGGSRQADARSAHDFIRR